MKIDPLSVLLNNTFKVDKKYYFISGNETTLMEKIKSEIIDKLKQGDNFQIKNIDTLNELSGEISLFREKSIFLVNSFRGIDEKSIKENKSSENKFIFVQENSQKIKKIKNLFISNQDSYVIDCYELDRDSKIKILNEVSVNKNNLEISQEIYWLLIDKLDYKYIFLEKNLKKILELDKKDITQNNIKKLLSIDDSGKERVFFYLIKKNREIVSAYREKIFTSSDVNDLYYYSKFFCQLIIDCKNKDEYSKKIPIYLFKEKNNLINIYGRYNVKKKKMLLGLLSSTEKILRKQNNLSLAAGLRFF